MIDPKADGPVTEALMQPALHMSAVAPHPAAATAVADVIDPRVALAASGDRAAAHALLTDLFPRVRNLVRYLVRGDDLVDDITQQVLVELLRSFGSFRHDGSLHGWVHRITVRVTLRQAKRQRRQRQQQAAIGLDLQTTAHPSDAPDQYLQRRQAIALLDQLPDDQRQALVLHHVAGMSVPELAEALGIPFETARSRLRLAVSKVRARASTSEDKP